MADIDPEEERKAEELARILDAWEDGQSGLNRLLDERLEPDEEVCDLLETAGMLRAAGPSATLDPKAADRIARQVQGSMALKADTKWRLPWAWLIPVAGLLLMLVLVPVSLLQTQKEPAVTPRFPNAVALSRSEETRYIEQLMARPDQPAGDHGLRELRQERERAYLVDYDWTKRYK